MAEIILCCETEPDEDKYRQGDFFCPHLSNYWGWGGGKTQELSTPFILLHGEKPGMWGDVLTQNEG